MAYAVVLGAMAIGWARLVARAWWINEFLCGCNFGDRGRGVRSKLLSTWAHEFREALFRWGEARGLRANDPLFPGGNAKLEQRF